VAKEVNDWKERAQSLLRAVKDLDVVDHPAENSPGSASHRALFEQYTARLRRHRHKGEAWLNKLIESEERQTGDREQAVANVLERRPVGAVAHPMVTGTVRRYWLACDSLNRAVPASQRVAPEEFVLLWLMRAGHDDLAEFLSAYPFWPIGLDSGGRWV
jgi:hypothetical protein